jgi:hypothetical protein
MKLWLNYEDQGETGFFDRFPGPVFPGTVKTIGVSACGCSKTSVSGQPSFLEQLLWI